MPPTIPVPDQSALAGPVRLVQADLAARLRASPDAIGVREVTKVRWPDTCLGLPAPELCAPGETPGYRITLEAFGATYTYHTDLHDTFRFAGPGDQPTRP